MNGGGRAGAGPFGGMVALLALTGAALFASATAGDPQTFPPPPTAEPPPSLDRAERIARELTPVVARRVERIRGLEFERVPTPRVISGQRFAEISARAAGSGPQADRELGDAAAAARLLGLMDAEESLDLLGEGAPDLAAAAYDTEAERLYVIFDVSGESRELLEFLLAHELDHALADQVFGIDEPKSATDDGALAGLALVEGSATSVMTEYAARHLNPLALSAATTGLDPGTDGVPQFFVESLTWAYLRGSGFVDTLREDAGGDWSFVDAAFRRPPTSTEQVLHSDRYLAGEAPLDVDAGPGVGDWKPVDRGVLGEFTTAQVLELGASERAAGVAAEGWGGDEYVLLSEDAGGEDCREACRSERALVVEWRADTARDARELERTLPAYLVGGLEAEPRTAGEWIVGAGYAVADRADIEVRLVFAPDRAAATALLEADGVGR